MGRCVLVVDDDPQVRELLSCFLETEGFEVHSARNGREAIEQLRADASACLILLDLMMPEMDGWEFRQQQLRDQSIAAIPVLVLSAKHDAFEQASALRAAGCIRKPFDLEELLESVRLVCGEKL